MGTRKTPINKWYAKGMIDEMVISMDAEGLFCSVPSETQDHQFHFVRVDESGLVPTVKSCDCRANGECKHMIIVQSYWNRIYRSNIAKAQQKAQDEQDLAKSPVRPKKDVVAFWNKAKGCYCYCLTGTPLEARDCEPIVKTPAQAVDVSTQGSLNAPTNWTSILPSRQKIAS